MPEQSFTALKFGAGDRFELQPAERRLLIDGQPATIGARALDLLIVLATQPDHLVTKDELLDRVWPGLVVEEGNLHVQVSALRKLLGSDVLTTVPGRGYRFSAPHGAAAVSMPAPAAASAPSMAPPSRLVGRDDDLASLNVALRESRHVTLAGISGVGKTSLARVVFAECGSRRGWVDLAALTSGQALADVVMRALAAQLGDGDVAAQLLRASGSEPLLLVLDNAEHLVDAVADLVTALRPAPALRVLVTSQVPLALEGEHVHRLEPLALPDGSAGTGGDYGGGALALLVQRIVAADRRFRVTPALLPLLQSLCVQLDGLPLALEMAAARVPTLGVQGVHDALAARFTLLTRNRRDAAARHRTLHDAVDWSYRLLDAAGQRLLRALGVFVGGFTVELAVGLCTGSRTTQGDARWEVIDGLALLVDRSLVAVSSDEPPRYRLLDTLRAFALEQLARATGPGETEAELRRAHASAVLELLLTHRVGDDSTAEPCLAEMANAGAALQWAVGQGDLELAARLSARMTSATTFSLWRHQAAQQLKALEPAMETAAAEALPPDARAYWWSELARQLVIGSDSRAASVAEKAYLMRRALNHPDETLFAASVWLRAVTSAGPEMDRAWDVLEAAWQATPEPTPKRAMIRHLAMGHASMRRGDDAAALEHSEAQLAIAEAHGWVNAAQAAECNVISRLLELNRDDEAITRGQVLLARLPEDNGNLPYAMCVVLWALARDAHRWVEAPSLLPRAWAAFQRFDVPSVLPRMVAVAARQGRSDDAARLLGHAMQAFTLRQTEENDDDRFVFARIREWLLPGLGDTRLVRLLRDGRQLSDEAARGLLLDA